MCAKSHLGLLLLELLLLDLGGELLRGLRRHLGVSELWEGMRGQGGGGGVAKTLEQTRTKGKGARGALPCRIIYSRLDHKRHLHLFAIYI